MFKPKRIQELLPVEFTPSELAALADQADELVSEMARLEQLKAGLPKKIESIKEQIYKVSAKRKAGFRDKLIDCEMIADPKVPEVVTIRLDTGEEIARRAMTESERQEDLFPTKTKDERLAGETAELKEAYGEPATEDSQANVKAFFGGNAEAAEWNAAASQSITEAEAEAEYKAMSQPDDEWNALLDQAEDEPEAEEAAKADWETCPLDYAHYLAFAKSLNIKNPASHAQKWNLTGEMEASVRQFLRQQAEAESDQADDFTADRCQECKRLDGAHDQNCTFHPDFALNVTPKKSRKGNSVQPTR